jgi:uncharacterized membrane protein
MAVEQFHDLFAASAGVAGALTGLLFVAISVAHERLGEGDSAQVHRIGAAAALTAFTNALVVSLFGLVPGNEVGGAALAVAIIGLIFVAASLLSLWRVHRTGSLSSRARDALFLVSLAVTFVLQLLEGLAADRHPQHVGDVRALSILVIVCFLIGITRAWVLIGGPSIGITRELGALMRGRSSGSGSEADEH